MSQQYYNNLYFLGVARLTNRQATVVASYNYNTETEIGAVKKVLEQPNLDMSAGKHYSFSVGQMAWHLIADDLGLIYIMIAQLNYPQRVSHACLEEFQRNFSAKAGDKATTAKDNTLSKQVAGTLEKICIKYDNLTEVDKLAAVSKKVESVKLVMQENVEVALQNCVKLESIEKAAEDLQQQAGVFKRNAKELKSKMWWKNIKMKLIIAAIILVILAIIIGVIVSQTKKNNN